MKLNAKLDWLLFRFWLSIAASAVLIAGGAYALFATDNTDRAGFFYCLALLILYQSNNECRIVIKFLKGEES